MKLWNRLFGRRSALIGVAVSVIATLGGCAPGAQRGETRERVYAGWVRFAGEFALYSDPSAFADSQTAHCLSGALPPDKQKEAAAQFSGKRVRVWARPVPWSLPDPDQLTLNNAGSPITNWCGDRVVLFASEMVLDDSPAEHMPYR
jgi:hypothetical protein